PGGSNPGGGAPGGTGRATAPAASAASFAAVSRSVSQVMRKLAIDGTKISTSASITNRMVSNSSLADKPNPRRLSNVLCRGETNDFRICQNLPGQAIASPSESRGTCVFSPRGRRPPKPRQPADDPADKGASGNAGIVAIGHAFVHLRKGRIG